MLFTEPVVRIVVLEDAYVNNQCMVAMYHAHLSEDMLHTTMADFKQANSTIRVVVSTVAFGVGIKIPDIQQVVHWGRLSSLMTYWQEVGRAGRDGTSARAVWYATSAAAGNDAVLKRLYADNGLPATDHPEWFVIADMNLSRLQQLESRQPAHSSASAHCVCAAVIVGRYAHATPEQPPNRLFSEPPTFGKTTAYRCGNRQIHTSGHNLCRRLSFV